MNRPRSFALLGIGSLLVGLATVLVYLGLLDLQLHRDLDRATATADAVVVAVDEDDDTYFSARWRDHQQREHTQRFSTYESHRKGTRFAVRYDPAHPDRKAFAADVEDRTDTDDVEVPMAIAVLVAVGFCAGWGYRWWVFRRVAKRPTSSVTAAVFSGANVGGSPLSSGRALWLRLGSEHWQRVM